MTISNFPHCTQNRPSWGRFISHESTMILQTLWVHPTLYVEHIRSAVQRNNNIRSDTPFTTTFFFCVNWIRFQSGIHWKLCVLFRFAHIIFYSNEKKKKKKQFLFTRELMNYDQYEMWEIVYIYVTYDMTKSVYILRSSSIYTTFSLSNRDREHRYENL